MKTQILYSFLALCLFGTFSLNAQRISGKGSIVTEEFQLDQFDGIRLAIPAHVKITQGEQQKVVVSGQKNILDLIERDIKGGAWEVEFDARHVNNFDKIHIEITMKNLEEVSLAGSGKVETTNKFRTDNDFDLSIAGSGKAKINIDAANIDCSIAGSGDVYLTGVTQDLDVEIAGSGSLEAYDLTTKHCSVSTAGSGDVEVQVSESLTASLVGSGDVEYVGNPKVKVSSIGSGKVRSRD